MRRIKLAVPEKVQILDPAQKLSLPTEVSIYSTIPGLAVDETPSLLAEWDIYNTAVLDLHGEVPIDLHGFWISTKSHTPRLANIALKYLALPVNSVDVERSFSVYNNVVSDKRHSLTLENTKMLSVSILMPIMVNFSDTANI